MARLNGQALSYCNPQKQLKYLLSKKSSTWPSEWSINDQRTHCSSSELLQKIPN